MAANKIVVANWKMNLSLGGSAKLAKEVADAFVGFDKGEVAVCPNFLSLLEVNKILQDSIVKVGAQDVFWEGYGAYTGEVCPEMLAEAGCKYVIVGHSERRKYFNANYELIHKQIKAVVENKKLIPIICVGENWDERKTNKRDQVLLEQIQQSFSGIVLERDQQVIVAYEPIWAIGSGTALEPEEAEYAHKFIKMGLNVIFGSDVAENNFRVIYGGSINPGNVDGFVGMDGLDGLLVGGASLHADEFHRVADIILSK